MADDIYVTVAGAGLKDGSTWLNAMGDGEFETHIEGSVDPDDRYWLEDGTYDFTGGDVDWNTRDGTAVAPITVIGVKSGTANEPPVFSDWSRDAADRPFFDCGVNRIRSSDYNKIFNISIEGGDYNALWLGASNVIENCKVYNDSATGGYDAINASSGNCKVINCEVESEAGHGIQGANFVTVLFSYIHDCDTATYAAVDLDGSVQNLAFNIFDSCAIGVKSASRDNMTILNNTFYETAVGVDETDGYGWICVNNIMEGNNTSGFDWDTQEDINYFWKNHGDDARCTDMWVNVATTGPHADLEVSTGDPKFTGVNDFSLQSDSPNIDAGMSIILGV